MFKIYSCIRCNHRYHNHYRYFKTINNENGNWLLQFDGGSRGLCEPRIAGAGAVLYAIEDDIKRIEKWTGYFFIGNATNNVAEYIALIEGIKQAIHFDIKNITIEGDSQLVISQLNGIYKVKHSNLIPLYKGKSLINFYYLSSSSSSSYY